MPTDSSRAIHTAPLLSLPYSPNVPLPQLTRDATPEELVEAAAANHISWFSDNARVVGGEVWQEGGLTFIYSPASDPGAKGEVILAFPRLDADTAGTIIEAAVNDARRREVRQVGCWSILPTEPTDFAARMVARGFQWGWQPHWMALDLEKVPPADFPLPANMHIALDDESDWEVEGLPHYNRADAARLQAHAQQSPRRTYHFGAWQDGKIVGHSLLHLSAGPLAVAGLYSVGVLPEARNQGVGRAISLAACQYAHALGCRYVLLNAATHIYSRLGFVSLGNGQTWFMFPPVLNAVSPTPEIIAFTEAVGRGDTAGLEALPPHTLPADLDAKLLCKMTPLEVAACLKQPRTAQWLLDAGATPEVIPLCDLGWRDRIPALLASRPDLANHRVGEWSQTPLHEAAARNDVELARLLLTANPDLMVEDTQFHGTPLGWARHMRREEIVRLIEAHRAERRV